MRHASVRATANAVCELTWTVGVLREARRRAVKPGLKRSQERSHLPARPCTLHRLQRWRVAGPRHVRRPEIVDDARQGLTPDEHLGEILIRASNQVCFETALLGVEALNHAVIRESKV